MSDREMEIFQQEKEAFMRLKHKLLETNKGKYVVIRNGEPVLFGDNKIELARAAYEKFGYVPLYIGLIQEELEVVYLHTPKVWRK
jgi:hypothetical protein